MRALRMCVAAIGLSVLLPLSAAWATPTVTYELKAEPIRGFAHTGDILGAGANARLEVMIHGDEYFDSPPPVIGFRFYAPRGSTVHEAGFAACAEATIVMIGPNACPRGSQAGPVGTVLGVVSFGGERVTESAELLPFIKPGGGLEYFAVGKSPVALEVMTTGRFSHLGGVEGYGFVEEEQVPLIATVPEGPLASVETIAGTFGAAVKAHRKTTYLFRLPQSCPKGGFRTKAEAIFAEGGDPSRPEVVTAFYNAPCPDR